MPLKTPLNLSPASLRLAVSLTTVFVVAACTDNRGTPLSQVQIIDVPVADAGPQANQNISNPTLEIPVTYPVADGDELTLVWSEEFDGPEIDPEKWFFATGDGSEKGLPRGWGNEELQYYLPDNAMIVNGVLEITARRETVGDFDFTSARINTEDRFAFKYGRVEASMKMPAGQGLWSAFWMLSQDSDYVCDANGRPCVWAAVGEIDIVEAINLDGANGNEIIGTIHYGDEFPNNQFTSLYYSPSVDITEGFHTYAIEWDEFEIRWYFDGQLYAVQNSWFSTALNGGPGAPFNQNFHILLNLAVGGNLPGSPNGATPFPATMEVDWVRVYSGEEPVAQPAGPGIVPDAAIYAADGSPADLTPNYDPFGSGSSFATVVDSSYANALAVTVGAGYGGGALAQLGLTGLAAGFATTFDQFVFKAKGLTADNTILVKLEAGGGGTVTIDLTAPPANVTVTDLGDGWSQVAIQISAFGDVSTSSQIVFQTLDGAYAQGSAFLLTDIGLSSTGSGGGTATGGEVPDDIIYAADGSMADLSPNYDPFGSGSSFATVVDNSYDNAFEITVGAGYGGGALAQLGLTGLAAGFATSYDEFLFKAKGLTADNTILVKLEAGGGGTVTIDLTAPPANVTVTDLGDGWSQVIIQIAAFGDVSTSSQIVFQTLDGAYAQGDTFLLTDIGFNNAGGGGGGGGGATGDIAINGGFETGMFNDGTPDASWQQFPGGGTQTITNVNPSVGTFAANLVVPVRGPGDPGVDNLIKNANLGAGSLMPNASVTVTFDMRGSLAGAGGVVFAELFSELTGGGTSKAEILGGGPLAPDAAWTNYSYTTTLGSDVSGGVTLQLKVGCGGVEGCGADVYFDNVTITIN